MTLFTGCVTDEIGVMREFLQKSKNFPEIQRLYEQGLFDTILVNDEEGLVLLRFHSPSHTISNYTYFAWSRYDKVPLRSLEGLYWISIEKRYQVIFHAEDIRVPEDGIVLHHGPLDSPVISSVKVQGDPLVIRNSKGLESYGDLWMNTWADDDVLYTGWGDGNGFGKVFTDMGFACFNGSLPLITGENLYLDPFNESDPLNENNKPSSLLFYNKTLYAHVHSPLGNADIGYIMYSKDYGRSYGRTFESIHHGRNPLIHLFAVCFSSTWERTIA
jgi:hypothetical protein